MLRSVSLPSRKTLALLLSLSLFGTTVTGCGDELPQGTVRQATTLADVPEKVLAAAKGALPGVTFQDAWKNVDGRSRALHSYEIRGKNEKGKVREVRVSTTGAILEME